MIIELVIALADQKVSLMMCSVTVLLVGSTLKSVCN